MKKINIQFKILSAISAIAMLLLIGTVFYRFIEDWTWIQSFYFSVTTLTTVGFGDFYPTNELSRLFTSVYVLSGTGITLTSLGIVGASYLKARENELLKRNLFSKKQ